jgi:choline-sulfatase
MAAYLGPLRGEQAMRDYVNFYAYLHRVVDEKVGRVMAALGDVGDPGSLRSRTLVVRCADHGEMGLSHGGLRQKAFNAYEETIHIPLVVSNPVLFPKPVETDALASLVDVLPTIASVAGASLDHEARGRDLSPILAAKAAPDGERLRLTPVDLSSIAQHPAPVESVQGEIHFTFDDHQAATALQDVAGQPNRVRAIRTPDAKFALYFDPAGEASSEFEMYDLDRDGNESRNLVARSTGEALDAADRALRSELGERLDGLMAANDTAPPY